MWSDRCKTHIQASAHTLQTPLCILCIWCIINSVRSFIILHATQLNTRVIYGCSSSSSVLQTCILFVFWISFSLLTEIARVYCVQYISRKLPEVCALCNVWQHYLCAINFVIQFLFSFSVSLSLSPSPSQSVSFVTSSFFVHCPLLFFTVSLLHFGQRHQPSLITILATLWM